MKLNKLGYVTVIMSIVTLSNVALAAPKCPKGEFYSTNKSQCVVDHGCRDGHHWSPKANQCVAKNLM